jgi:cytochrome P450 family 150 subfamily A5
LVRPDRLNHGRETARTTEKQPRDDERTQMTDIGSIEDIDFFRDQATALNPYDFLGLLAENRPVYRETYHDVFMISGYDESLAVLRDTETFSNALIVAGPDFAWSEEFDGADDMTEFIEAHRGEFPMNDQIITFDPPVHTNHRALLAGLITPKRLKENEDFMWRLVDRQLDVVLTGEPVEIIDRFAQPYTLLVIADLLGVPEADHPALLRRMGFGGTQMGSAGPSEPSAQHHGLEHHYPYFIEAIEDRRQNPTDDVLTRMALARFPDGSLPEPIDGARIAANLFAAGQETTVRLIAAALLRIADDRQIQRALRANRSLIPKFVEETLRFEGPIKGAFRIARRAGNVGGVDIPIGSKVMVMNGAANRDARQFADPDAFDPNRPNVRRHIAFGHGAHTCPGAPLARSETRVTIERLFDRTDDIRISEAAHGPATDRRWNYSPSYMFRALTRLTLEFDVSDSESTGTRA